MQGWCRSRAHPAPWLGLFLLVLPGSARADDWPQWLGPRRDGVWRENGILEKFPEGGPKVLWRRPVGGGYTGPAVVGDRVYVMDRERAKDDQGNPLRPKEGAILGNERILCLNAANGEVIWKHEYDCPYKKIDLSYGTGPRTTPVVHEGKLYALGTMGDLHCLDAATGKVIWAKNFMTEYKVEPPVWGWSSHPLVDGDKVICLVGGEGSAVVAFHKDNGKELWRALTVDEIGYAPPMIYEAGGARQLIVFHTEAVNSLDPETGKLYWSEPHPPHGKVVRPGISIATPRKEGDLLLVSAPHHGSLMLKLDADQPRATVLWRGKSDNVANTDGLHALICTPVLTNGHIYGICSFGELRCLKADTGERLWETYAAVEGKKAFFGTAFLVQHADRFFIFSDKGDLIIAKLSPAGYEEVSRAHLLDPVQHTRGRDIVWSHPAFANKCFYGRNDKEIMCVSLAAESG